MRALTEETGELLECSVKEGRRLARIASSQGAWARWQAKQRAAETAAGACGSLREGRLSDPPTGA